MKRLVALVALTGLALYAYATARAWWPVRIEVAFDDPYLTEPWGDC